MGEGERERESLVISFFISDRRINYLLCSNQHFDGAADGFNLSRELVTRLQINFLMSEARV